MAAEMSISSGNSAVSPTLLPEALLATYQIIINSFLISFPSCGALPPVPASGG